MTTARIHLIVFLLIGLSACDGSGASDRCEPVSQELISALETGLTVDGGGSLGDAQAVRSEDFERVWFVAAEIDGPGLEGSGEVGVWATNSAPSGPIEGGFFAIDALAQEFSDWAPGDQSDAQISMADDGVEEARSCVG